MNSVPASQRRARGRRRLIGVAAVFVLPMLAAWLWFFNVDALRPGGSSNHGELIRPAHRLTATRLLAVDGRELDGAALERHWTLVHVVTGDCSDRCQRNLYHSRQARLALGRDVQRVQRLLLTRSAARMQALEPESLASQHPDLLIVAAPDLIAQIHDAETGMAPRADAIYLVDPLLNVMLRFPAELDPRLMIRDLKKLLKISQIG